MKPLPDPDHYLDQHMQQAAKEHAKWISMLGLKPTTTLLRAISDREFERARDAYILEARLIHQQNIDQINKEHRRQLRQLKWRGIRLRWKVCPPITLLFAVISWYSFNHSNPEEGFIYAGTALAFLAMLVLGAIFDRPRPV